ncbi:jacalin-related lectin 38-like [Papaver somniferum]|uniref:jacalin-related lectin 38-like n=1 Tax=Papaver somniferum TaxID=3469 RepID=UPI000E6FAD5A|nr:jacalin-related lectin 38-like [Papaver somniferum]
MPRPTGEDVDAEQPLPVLPEELILEILRKLLIESLLNFRCVCKNWNIIFRNPNFINNKFSFLLKYDKKLDSLDYNSSASLSDTDNPPIKEIRYPLQCMIEKLAVLGSCNGLHIPYVISIGSSVSAPWVLCNGDLHWIGKSYSGNRPKVLIALDVGNETVQEIPQPENLDVENFGGYRYVNVLDKCLCMLCSSHMDDEGSWSERILDEAL